MARTMSMTLEECYLRDPNLFDFDYDMPEEYKPRFEEMFIKRFYYRNIGFDSYQMFKHYLESFLNEILPKYRGLYVSENIISNPFINYASQIDSWQRQRGNSKNYQTAINKSYASYNGSGGSSNVSRTGANGGRSSNQLNRRDSINKDKSINDNNVIKNNLYSDTPQSPKQEENSFNDGYVTTKELDKTRMSDIKSGTTEGYEQNANSDSEVNYQNTANYGTSVNENQSVNNDEGQQSSVSNSGLENTRKLIAQEYGLKNVTVSQILKEWRQTFINIDKMLLDELEENLFILVY